jgi:hypothetical protein
MSKYCMGMHNMHAVLLIAPVVDRQSDAARGCCLVLSGVRWCMSICTTPPHTLQQVCYCSELAAPVTGNVLVVLSQSMCLVVLF